jgi:simple sugar transport system permease protein
MMNFVANAVLLYFLSGALKDPNQQGSIAQQQTPPIEPSAQVGSMVPFFNKLGFSFRMKLAYIRYYGFTGIAIALLGRNSGLGIVAAALLWSFFDRASSGIGLNTTVPKEVTTIMQGVIILTIVIAHQVVRRMTARRQLREQHDRA